MRQQAPYSPNRQVRYVEQRVVRLNPLEVSVLDALRGAIPTRGEVLGGLVARWARGDLQPLYLPRVAGRSTRVAFSMTAQTLNTLHAILDDELNPSTLARGLLMADGYRHGHLDQRRIVYQLLAAARKPNADLDALTDQWIELTTAEH